jgi:hypothetical protein
MMLLSAHLKQRCHPLIHFNRLPKRVDYLLCYHDFQGKLYCDDIVLSTGSTHSVRPCGGVLRCILERGSWLVETVIRRRDELQRAIHAYSVEASKHARIVGHYLLHLKLVHSVAI